MQSFVPLCVVVAMVTLKNFCFFAFLSDTISAGPLVLTGYLSQLNDIGTVEQNRKFCFRMTFSIFRQLFKISLWHREHSQRKRRGDPTSHLTCLSVCLFAAQRPNGWTDWNETWQVHVSSASAVAWHMKSRIRYPVSMETGKNCFLPDSGHFGRHFLRNQDLNQKSGPKISPPHHDVSIEPTFSALLRKLQEEIHFSRKSEVKTLKTVFRQYLKKYLSQSFQTNYSSFSTTSAMYMQNFSLAPLAVAMASLKKQPKIAIFSRLLIQKLYYWSYGHGSGTIGQFRSFAKLEC